MYRISRVILLSGLAGIFAFGCTPTNDLELVKTKLHEQLICWNKGDIDCFMEYYWQSDSLSFIGSSGITRRWQNTLERYKKTYPDKESMGELIFQIISSDRLGAESIRITGTWKLIRAEDSPGGYFTLIWKKIDNNWVIVYDHTS